MSQNSETPTKIARDQWETIHRVDDALFRFLHNIDIIDAVAPLNYRQEKESFFASNFSRNPQFVYASHSLDVFQMKRALFNLPVDRLGDEDLVSLYMGIVESYVDKLDQFQSIGTPDFFYNSLRYYGEPSDKDIRNANFVLHVQENRSDENSAMLSASEVAVRFEAFAQEHGYQYELQLSDSMIANAQVSGSVIKINRSATISEIEVNALMHHELGVHLVTTLNARQQPLRVLSLGCPVNTTTQEGLAILCEYLAGYMTLSRLRVLALRVIAVNAMIKDKDFKRTFLLLKEQHHVSDEMAFTITSRVYRGGGFTKDYLYLQGFHQMLNAYEHCVDFDNLLCGKVSIDCLPIVTRLIEKEYLVEPRFISPAIVAPQPVDAVNQFVAHAIK